MATWGFVFLCAMIGTYQHHHQGGLMTATIGTPGTFPQVRILDRSGEPLYVLHGAAYYDDTNNTDMGGRIVTLFDDLFDDEHDRCYAFESKVIGLTVEYLHEAGFRGRMFLVSVKHYTDGMTPETWLTASHGKRFEIADCNPDTCMYGFKRPHRIGAPYVPPSQGVAGTMYHDGGPRAVDVEFLWTEGER